MNSWQVLSRRAGSGQQVGRGGRFALLQQAARIQQPLLMAYGEWDQRVPLVHGEKMRDALKALVPRNASIAECEKFGAVDKAALAMKRFPVAERAGLVWAILDPASPHDPGDLLGGKLANQLEMR